MTLPLTALSASTAMPTPRESASLRKKMLRMRLPCTTASRPPSLKLVTEMPIAASSTMLLAITAPSKANSA